MELDSQRFARWAEEEAARRLEADGWEVLARNYRAGPREVDLVVRRGPVTAFVEVKARRSGRFGDPLEAIDRKKRADLAAAAHRWLEENPEFSPVVRFDAVTVAREGGHWRVRHVPDAWSLD